MILFIDKSVMSALKLRLFYSSFYTGDKLVSDEGYDPSTSDSQNQRSTRLS